MADTINFQPGTTVGENVVVDGRSWTWDGKKWVSDGNTSTNKYVNRSGDTMTGTLEIANEGGATNLDFDPDKANLTFTTTKTDGSASESVSIHQNGLNPSLSITGGVVADGNYFTETGRYYGSDPSGQYFAARPPFLQLEQTEGTLQWNDKTRLQWNATNVEIPKPAGDGVNTDGFIIRGTTAAGYETDDPLNENGKLLSTFHNANTADAVNYEGKINNPSNLVNKQYVDDKDDLLRQDIIELEEEINAIAPSIEYGTWKYEEPNNGDITLPPSAGTFYLVNGGALTNQYLQTTEIKIHNDEFVAPDDQDPVDNHTWEDANVGELIQLFDAADPDFFLGRITAKNVDEINEFVTLTVDRIQSSGIPDDTPDPLTQEFLTRVNIFKEPSGGTASEFVLKSGDTMSGNLIISKSTNVAAALTLTGERPDATESAATIKFENKTNPGSAGFLTYRTDGTDTAFRFDNDLELNNKNLKDVGHIKMRDGSTIQSDDKQRILVRTPTQNNAATQIQRPGDELRTFSIRGKVKNSSSVQDIFWAYGNKDKVGDAINYTGLVTQDNHIVNKKYVDDRVLPAGGSDGMVLKIRRSDSKPAWQGAIDIGTSSNGRAKGEMWYNSNDGVLYLKVS